METCSRCRGIRVHDPVETVFTIAWNTHCGSYSIWNPPTLYSHLGIWRCGESRMTTQQAQVQTRTQRLRRVMLLACHFSRNLGYHRAGMSHRRSRISEEYWKTVTSNCLDVCILEWCKLFADPRDPHHWRNVVSAPAASREIYTSDSESPRHALKRTESPPADIVISF